MLENSTPAAPAPKATRSSAWPFAFVLLALVLVVGGTFGYILISGFNRAMATPSKMVTTLSQAAADAMRPRLTINQVVIDAIEDVHKTNKLVVFETTLNTDVTREEGSASWGVYWGTNVARVAVRDANVPYVIDLSQIGTSDFQFDPDARVLTLTIPRPKIDTRMVSIDPAKIQTLDLRGGWARFDKHETRENAIAELRPKLITQAQAPFIRKLAEEAGIESMTTLLQPLASTLAKDGATIKIIYTQ